MLRIIEENAATDPQQTMAVEALIHIADLGYASVLKGYGLLGLTWLFLFLFTLFTQGYRAYQQGDAQQRTLALFALGYLLFVTISGLTINHFMFAEGILMLCLVAALLARLRWDQSKAQEAQNV